LTAGPTNRCFLGPVSAERPEQAPRFLPWLKLWDRKCRSSAPAVIGIRLAPDDEKKAAKGDESALPAVNAYLANPAAVLLWGDVGRHLLLTWVRRYANDNLVMGGAMLRVASDLRSQLAGPNPSAVDVLLAERVVLGWVFCLWCEWQYAVQVEKDLSIKQSEFHLRRIGMAQRGLTAACGTLAKVKRMKLPEVLALVNVNSSRVAVPQPSDAGGHFVGPVSDG
jgi:hypothetical protein